MNHSLPRGWSITRTAGQVIVWVPALHERITPEEAVAAAEHLLHHAGKLMAKDRRE